MKKSILLKALFATLLLSLPTLRSFAYDFSAENEDGKTIYYNITSSEEDNCTVEVTYLNNNYSSSNKSAYTGEVSIPSSVEYNDITYSVTSIGKSTFHNCSNLISIEIPNSVTSIENYAFEYCTSLTTVTFEDNSQLKSIGESAFQYCSSFISIEIPNSVTSIGTEAFYECISLTSIEIPSSVTSIGVAVFIYCSSLTNIEVANDNEYYCSKNGVLFSKDMTELIEYPAGLTETSYEIPSSVTSIGWFAFGKCTSLTSIEIPSSVTSIGWGAFHSCTGLTSVKIPYGVTSIEAFTFKFCTNLTSVEIPNTVTSMGGEAFDGCENLTSIEIPNSVTNIGPGTFTSCYGLISIILPSSVTSVDYPFLGCSSLASLEIQGDITSCNNLLEGCSKLTNITIGENVTILPSGLFSYCSTITNLTYNAENCTSIDELLYKNNNITSITIGENVKSIPEDFNHFSSLTTLNYNAANAELPSGYTTSIFANCTELSDITIGETVEFIPAYLFANLTAIESIEIPSSVTSIGDKAFYNCTSIEEIYVSNTTPTECGDNAFENVSSECVLYVPVGSEEDYSNYEGTLAWNNFTSVTGVYYTSVTDDGITLKAPTESSEISCNSIAAGNEIVVVANVSGTMTVTVYDTESTDTLYNGDIESVDAISASSYKYTWTCPSDITFYEGHTYALDIALSESGSTTLITYNVTTDNIILQSVSSDEDTTWTVAEDKNIVLTFSGFVKIDKDNTFIVDNSNSEDDEDAKTESETLTIEATGSDTTDDGYSSEWTITVGADDVAAYNGSSISIYVTAVDENGNTIYDEDGNEITLSYTVNIPTDGINAVNAITNDGRIYNLSGQRVNNMNRRGIYIVNGKKVARK